MNSLLRPIFLSLLVTVSAVRGGALSVSNWKGFTTNPIVDRNGTTLTDSDPVIVVIGTFASEPATAIPGSGQILDTGAYAALLAEFTEYGSPVGIVPADGALERKGSFVFQENQLIAGTLLEGKPVYVLIAKGSDLPSASEAAIIRTTATFDTADDSSPFPKLVGVGTPLGSIMIAGSDTLFTAVPTSLDATPQAAYSLAQIVSASEIAVEQPTGSDLTTSVSVVDFDKVAMNDHRSLTFTIRSTGTSPLSNLSPGLTGANFADFTVSSAPPGSIPGGESATFVITFTPSMPGLHSAMLSISSSDENENPFDIALTGTGDDAKPMFDEVLANTAPELAGPDAEPTATPFNDGIANLLKYALNMNPAGPDTHAMVPGGTSGMPWSGIVTQGDTLFLQIQHVRRKGSGLIYTPLKSTTLDSFVPMTGVTEIQDIDALWERFIISEPYDPEVTPQYFGRIKVELPTP